MDDQARAIGRRVRYWRTRRNLGRQRFADMVGRSTSWLDKIEKGERNLLRLPMLERVADALGVDPAVLTDGAAAQRATDCVDAVEVQAIRTALGRYPSLSAGGTDRRVATTDRMRAELPGREQELLSLYGMLFLVGAVTAARHDDAALALAMHQEAEIAADRMGPRHETHQTSFGRANVAVHRVAALVRLHEDGRAVEYAQGIAPALIGTLPPEHHANYLLDLTEAYIHTGYYHEAVRTLSKAEQGAPEEVRCRPLAHGLLRSLVEHTSGESSRLVRQMATRAGVPA